jgi:phosphoglycolate phosphatase
VEFGSSGARTIAYRRTVSLLVFDLDGTLIDSRRDLAESTNELLSSYGAAPLDLDAVSSFVGDGAKMLVLRALARAKVNVDLAQALTTFLGIYDRRLLESTRPYDGIAEVVAEAAARVPLAVLTNKPGGPTRRLLDAFDLSRHFRWVIGGDDAYPRKPDPAALHALVGLAETTAAQTLMIGDSMVDVETGRNAGTRVCGVLYGFAHYREGLSLREDEFTAETPADLQRVVGKFLR